MSQIKKDQSGCFILPRSKTEVREISQPVRLTQGGLSSKKLQDDQRNILCKLSQPERLTPYGKKEGSCKKNAIHTLSQPERLTPYGKKRGSCKKNLIATLSKPERLTPYLKSTQSSKKDTLLQHKTKSVRRNLDFTASSKKETRKLSDRKSLLLQPNTIKNTYIKKRQSTFVLPYCRELATTSENKERPRLFEKTCSSSTEKGCSNINKREKKNATLAIPRILLSVPSTIDESGINIAYSPQTNTCTSGNEDAKQELSSDQGFHSTVCTSPKVTNNLRPSEPEPNAHRATEEEIAKETHSVNVTGNPQLSQPEPNANRITEEEIAKETHTVNETEKFACTSSQKENAQSSLEIVKTLAVPVPCGSNGSDERVVLRKADLTALELKLSRVIGRLKEDLSELTAVANMISAINSAGETNNKDGRMNERTENLNENIVADVPEEKNSEAQPSRQVGFSLESSKENEDSSSNTKCFENKSKFKTRRRSARLMAKSLSNLYNSNSNDSFVNLENQLNIIHADSDTKCASVKKCKTPDVSKYKKINEKPLREYLALKSGIKCLVTPKTPKSFSISDLGHMCLESSTVKANKSNISRKVLSEIFSLYEESS